MHIYEPNPISSDQKVNGNKTAYFMPQLIDKRGNQYRLRCLSQKKLLNNLLDA